MTNYKPFFPTAIQTVGDYQTTIEDGERIATLISVAGSANNASMLDISDGIAYQVPTGKSARIICIVQCHFGLVSHKVRYSDGLDVMTNPVTIHFNRSILKQPDNMPFFSSIIPTGKYIGVNVGATPMILDLIYILFERAW